MKNRLIKEMLGLSGVWLGCMVLAGACAGRGGLAEYVGNFFFALFLLLTLILFVFGPVRRARLERRLSRERREAREAAPTRFASPDVAALKYPEEPRKRLQWNFRQ